MEELEVSAKTVDEAIALALDKLQVDRSEVEIEVLSKGKPGIFGFGVEQARIVVKPRLQPPSENVAALANEVLERLLTLMKVPAIIQLSKPSGGKAGEAPVPITLDISGDDLGILIGHRGETLSSLQYLLNLIVSRRLKVNAGVTIDVERYRERRHEALQDLALRIANQVKSTGRSISLEPMPPSERRIIHLALRDDPDVATQSVGQGESRKVAILPKKSQ